MSTFGKAVLTYAPPLPTYEEWTWDALCNGQDPENWYTESLPQGSADGYFDEAESRCAGCQFMQQCAERALYYDDIGVIVAGVPLLSSVVENENQGRYDMLRKIVGGNPAREPRKPSPATTLLSDDFPTKTDPTHFFLNGFRYTSHAGAMEILGIQQRQIDNLIAKGELPITKYKMRKGSSNIIYFLVDEVQRAKEKWDAEREAARVQRRENRREATRLHSQRYRERLKAAGGA